GRIKFPRRKRFWRSVGVPTLGRGDVRLEMVCELLQRLRAFAHFRVYVPQPSVDLGAVTLERVVQIARLSAKTQILLDLCVECREPPLGIGPVHVVLGLVNLLLQPPSVLLDRAHSFWREGRLLTARAVGIRKCKEFSPRNVLPRFSQ